MSGLPNRLSLALFDFFLIPYTRLRLAGIVYDGLDVSLPPGHSVITAANHPGWWDGFLIRDLHRKIGGSSRFYTLMLEETIRENRFLAALGGIGIKEGHAASLKRAIDEVRHAHEAGPIWLSIFPQGHLHPSWDSSYAFKKGIALFARALRPTVILPVGLHLEVLADPRPYAFVSIGEPLSVGPHAPPSAEKIREAVESELTSIRTTILNHREEAPLVFGRR